MEMEMLMFAWNVFGENWKGWKMEVYRQIVMVAMIVILSSA